MGYRLFVLIEFGSSFVSVDREEVNSSFSVGAESKTVRTVQGSRNELESIGTALSIR
jgi:hypothetical protein